MDKSLDRHITALDRPTSKRTLEKSLTFDLTQQQSGKGSSCIYGQEEQNGCSVFASDQTALEDENMADESISGRSQSKGFHKTSGWGDMISPPPPLQDSKEICDEKKSKPIVKPFTDKGKSRFYPSKVTKRTTTPQSWATTQRAHNPEMKGRGMSSQPQTNNKINRNDSLSSANKNSVERNISRLHQQNPQLNKSESQSPSKTGSSVPLGDALMSDPQHRRGLVSHHQTTPEGRRTRTPSKKTSPSSRTTENLTRPCLRPASTPLAALRKQCRDLQVSPDLEEIENLNQTPGLRPAHVARRLCNERLQSLVAHRRSASAASVRMPVLAQSPACIRDSPTRSPIPRYDSPLRTTTPNYTSTSPTHGARVQTPLLDVHAIRSVSAAQSQGNTKMVAPRFSTPENFFRTPHLDESLGQDDSLDETQPRSEGLRPLARFRLVVWLAICLRRLLAQIIQVSGEKTYRSATELQWMEIYAEKHDASLAFNKHLFSRDRVIAHVPFWAQVILGTPPELRTETHCRKLHALLRGLRAFDKFTEEIQMALCKAFTLERVEESRVVLKNGHVGLNFYFIYSGSVFVNQEDKTKQGRVFTRTVATLSRGDSFGELALLQDIRRTATISVRERCELLVVDRDIFASVCPRIFDKQLAEKQAFIKNLDLFSPKYWAPESIHSLSMNSQIQEFKTNKIIVGDSSLEDWVYICMMGKCQVIRCLSLGRAPSSDEQTRKDSDVVLSEEILQLLAATGSANPDVSLDPGDSRENMLTSLELDYVKTSKKLYLSGGVDVERQRAVLGLNEATTLTSFMRRQRELGKTDLVYLNVGVLESGQVFDLSSLLSPKPANQEAGASTLMLVSGGARIVRIKKAAFLDQASQRALDHIRTMASKQCHPSEQTILESYKTKVAWENFKASVVQQIKRETSNPEQLRCVNSHLNGRTRSRENSARNKNSRIISALQNFRNSEANVLDEENFSDATEEEDDLQDVEDEEAQTAGYQYCDIDTDQTMSTPRQPLQRRKWSLTLEDMTPTSGIQDKIIIRRQPSGVNRDKKIKYRGTDTVPTPRTTISSSAATWMFPPALRMA